MMGWVWAISGFTSGVISVLAVQDIQKARRKLAEMRAEFQRERGDG